MRELHPIESGWRRFRGSGSHELRFCLLSLPEGHRGFRFSIGALILLAAFVLACMHAPVACADPGGSVREIRPALLPVPYTEDDRDDPSFFNPARRTVVLHESILLPGWLKEPEFEELQRWLIAQGFAITRALGPESWRTYPEIKFSGTVRQIEEAFHVSVMEKVSYLRPCYTVFTNLLMPARFAPKGEDYIERFAFDPDGSPGFGTSCP
jgi:hypothetical protein